MLMARDLFFLAAGGIGGFLLHWFLMKRRRLRLVYKTRRLFDHRDTLGALHLTDEAHRTVDALYRTRLFIWNEGRRAIGRDELVSDFAARINVGSEAQILTITKLVEISPFSEVEVKKVNHTTVDVIFRQLNYRSGATFDLLISGMPQIYVQKGEIAEGALRINELITQQRAPFGLRWFEKFHRRNRQLILAIFYMLATMMAAGAWGCGLGFQESFWTLATISLFSCGIVFYEARRRPLDTLMASELVVSSSSDTALASAAETGAKAAEKVAPVVDWRTLLSAIAEELAASFAAIPSDGKSSEKSVPPEVDKLLLARGRKELSQGTLTEEQKTFMRQVYLHTLAKKREFLEKEVTV
jgi:hypothetical protein